jgi:hypothetical protein
MPAALSIACAAAILRALAGIAQLVERVIRNDEVVGSIPISGTMSTGSRNAVPVEAGG